MITQIEIDGFKTFKDFKVELSPFQVIVGANGSGKSNLFDALHLLSRLATHNLSEAFQGLRGAAREQFTRLPDGSIIPKMRLTVELLLNRHTKDTKFFDRQIELLYTRLRYTVEVGYKTDELSPDTLYLLREELKTLLPKNDHWLQKYGPPGDFLSQESSDKEIIFIHTVPYSESSPQSPQLYQAADDEPTIIMHFRDDNGRANTRSFIAREFSGTILSTWTGSDFPPLSAVCEEMRNWRILHLDPDEIRQPSPVTGSQFITASGGNLPTMLARMQRQDKFALDRVSSDLAYMVPEVLKVQVEKNPARDTYDLWVETQDHRRFSANVLSDGTVRLLALAAMKNDLRLSGMLCLEEPENGVNPLNLQKMIQLLRLIATNFSDMENSDEPLTQVIVTTHSPLVASQPDVIDALLLAFVPTHIRENASPMRVTRMAPVMTSEALSHLEDVSRDDKAIGAYTTNMLLDYLDSELLEEARERLEKGHRELNKR